MQVRKKPQPKTVSECGSILEALAARDLLFGLGGYNINKQQASIYR